jgi:hypothetical protein
MEKSISYGKEDSMKPKLEDDVAMGIESDDCEHGIDRGNCEDCSSSSEPDRMWGDED